jgi:hypothetical protein
LADWDTGEELSMSRDPLSRHYLSMYRRVYALFAIAVLALGFLAFQLIGQSGNPVKATAPTPVTPVPKKVE